jgi:UPF0755 protein
MTENSQRGETPTASRKPSGKLRNPLLFVLLVVVLGFIWLSVDVCYFLYTPANSNPTPIVVEVPPGVSLSALAELLQKEGLVRSAERFRWLVRLSGQSRKIKSGEYQLSAGLRPGELVDKLVRGEVLLHQITFPEGYTLKQMARLLGAQNLAGYHPFMAAATDSTFVSEFGIEASTLEGYLFPDTYRFARGLSVQTIIRSMVARFNRHFTAVREEQARKLGMTRHQVVILASVIEKETAVSSERPLIAGVFFNRLNRSIPLQSDPTVIYGLKDFDGNLTRSHLQSDTPYNTYTRLGLPVGPICNPGDASLEAALNPASTSHLYFVAKRDGTHYFSDTLAEHNAAVLRYQKRRR